MFKNTAGTIYDCIIVGAGASGLFYAAADKEAAMKGADSARKLLLEKTDHPGQKLLLSGSGACNITHGGSIKDFISHYADKGPKIRGCLYKHSNLELMRFMEDAGVPLMQRDDGKIFPASLKARDVLEALLAKASRNGFALLCNCEVTGIHPEAASSTQADDPSAELMRVTLRSGASLRTRRLIIATGGASYPATGSDGSFLQILKRDLCVRTEELKPALAPVFVEHYPYTKLSGISFDDVEITCKGHATRGPLLLTHRGFSGPAVLHISQYVSPGDKLVINYLAKHNIADVYRKIRDDQPGNKKGVANYIAQEFDLPKAFAAALLSPDGSAQTVQARKLSGLGHKELENLVHLMMARTYTVSGTGGFKEAMVTAGGVSLEEIERKNMSLRNYPSVHIIGEALDINGDTGGYNLQFAYSSALAAIK